MTRKRRRSKRRRSRTGFGRLFEGMAVLVLLLVVLTFGISIASRFLPESDSSARERTASNEAFVLPRPSSQLVEEAQVEVQNGCGRDGLARLVGSDLRAAEFDVLEWKDAKRYDHQVTSVLVEERFRDTGAAVAAFLQRHYGVGVLELGEIPDGVADIQVILGHDLDAVLDARDAP